MVAPSWYLGHRDKQSLLLSLSSLILLFLHCPPLDVTRSLVFLLEFIWSFLSYIAPFILTEEHPPLPVWPLEDGEQSQCPEGEIQCGSGECIPKELYCNFSPECADGSDENICSECRSWRRGGPCLPQPVPAPLLRSNLTLSYLLTYHFLPYLLTSLSYQLLTYHFLPSLLTYLPLPYFLLYLLTYLPLTYLLLLIYLLN